MADTSTIMQIIKFQVLVDFDVDFDVFVVVVVVVVLYMTEAATRRCSAKKVIFFPGLQYCGHWLTCSERKGYYHRRPVFLPSHFARDRMRFILLVIQVFWCKAEIQNRRTSQNIQLLNRTPQFTKSL